MSNQSESNRSTSELEAQLFDRLVKEIEERLTPEKVRMTENYMTKAEALAGYHHDRKEQVAHLKNRVELLQSKNHFNDLLLSEVHYLFNQNKIPEALEMLCENNEAARAKSCAHHLESKRLSSGNLFNEAAVEIVEMLRLIKVLQEGRSLALPYCPQDVVKATRKLGKLQSVLSIEKGLATLQFLKGKRKFNLRGRIPAPRIPRD